jgi:cytochrome c553
MRSLFRFPLCLAAALTLGSSAALAGDVAAGKAKAMACGACHGSAGISTNPMWPNLAGQKEIYLAKQMRDFKSQTRKDPVMVGMAKNLSDDDINNLAAYYASLK